MRRGAARLPLALALLAWVAQLCLPVLHAAVMAAPRAEMLGWCGNPSQVLAAIAEMPAEIREALDLHGAGTDHVVDCAKLCATGSTPPLATVASTVALRAAGLEPAPAIAPAPRSREQAPTPPAQGPPAHA